MRVRTISESESEDSLLALAARPPSPPPPPESPSPSSFDSQLTLNLDPNIKGREDEEVAEVVQPLAHWSDMHTFWRSVQTQLVCCVNEHWFHNEVFVDRCSVKSVTAAIDYVRNDVLRVGISEYKFGITESPHVRWHNDEFGYGPQGWQGMALLYCAPFSSAARLGSTGSMERALISEFRDDERCANIAKGGEGASRASPHFAYVVWR